MTTTPRDWAEPHDWFHLSIDIAPGQDPDVVRHILDGAVAQLQSVFLDGRYARITMTEGHAMTTTPRAWYSRTSRDWVLTPGGGSPTDAAVWRDEAGDVRHFLTAQDAYDAWAPCPDCRHTNVDHDALTGCTVCPCERGPLS